MVQQETQRLVGPAGTREGIKNDKTSRYLHPSLSESYIDSNQNHLLLVPLDLTGSPGLDQLSPAEKELCGALRLYPQQYMIIKEALIRESLVSGQSTLSKGHVKKLVKLGTRLFTYRLTDSLFTTPLHPQQQRAARQARYTTSWRSRDG